MVHVQNIISRLWIPRLGMYFDGLRFYGPRFRVGGSEFRV
jgi:hypothetical protein